MKFFPRDTPADLLAKEPLVLAGVAQQPFCSQSSQQSTHPSGFGGVLKLVRSQQKKLLVLVGGFPPSPDFFHPMLVLLVEKMMIPLLICSSLKSTIQVSKFVFLNSVGEFFWMYVLSFKQLSGVCFIWPSVNFVTPIGLWPLLPRISYDKTLAIHTELTGTKVHEANLIHIHFFNNHIRSNEKISGPFVW